MKASTAPATIPTAATMKAMSVLPPWPRMTRRSDLKSSSGIAVRMKYSLMKSYAGEAKGITPVFERSSPPSSDSSAAERVLAHANLPSR